MTGHCQNVCRNILKWSVESACWRPGCSDNRPAGLTVTKIGVRGRELHFQASAQRCAFVVSFLKDVNLLNSFSLCWHNTPHLSRLKWNLSVARRLLFSLSLWQKSWKDLLWTFYCSCNISVWLENLIDAQEKSSSCAAYTHSRQIFTDWFWWNILVCRHIDPFQSIVSFAICCFFSSFFIMLV